MSTLLESSLFSHSHFVILFSGFFLHLLLELLLHHRVTLAQCKKIKTCLVFILFSQSALSLWCACLCARLSNPFLFLHFFPIVCCRRYEPCVCVFFIAALAVSGALAATAAILELTGDAGVPACSTGQGEYRSCFCPFSEYFFMFCPIALLSMFLSPPKFLVFCYQV